MKNYLILLVNCSILFSLQSCLLTKTLEMKVDKKTKIEKSYIEFKKSYTDSASLNIYADRYIKNQKSDYGLLFKFNLKEFESYKLDTVNKIYAKEFLYNIWVNGITNSIATYFPVEIINTPSGNTTDNSGNKKSVNNLKLSIRKNDNSNKEIPLYHWKYNYIKSSTILDNLNRLRLTSYYDNNLRRTKYISTTTKSNLDSIFVVDSLKNGFITYYTDLSDSWFNYYFKDKNGNYVCYVIYVANCIQGTGIKKKPVLLSSLILLTVPIDIVTFPIQLIIALAGGVSLN